MFEANVVTTKQRQLIMKLQHHLQKYILSELNFRFNLFSRPNKSVPLTVSGIKTE